MISRLSVRLSSMADNGGLCWGAVGRCRQICIWLHRAGCARSQKREMKFDRSDRDPLAFGSSTSVSKPPPPPPSRSSRHPVATSRAAKWCWHAHPSGFRTFGVPHGHRRAPPSLAHVVLSPPPRSLGAPHFIRFSFICYLPAATTTAAAGYAPPGASAEAGLLSSNPTPFYKYITRPSGPLPRLTPGPTVSYRCPIVTLSKA